MTPFRVVIQPPASAEEEIRQLIYGRRSGRYRIFFTIRADVIHVLHVRHGARDYLEPSPEE